ncbi:ammonium transporter [Nisaea nitritireducens]|uniref:ammonium transporter n=1 Tax=Nisaea nitritireducens TaxID=568392 RepID=UPI001867C814|nr:ammonium transporter [Nisaea nitritireducens]
MTHIRRLASLGFTTAAAFGFGIGEARAADALSSGDTAWILTATALVLFMTLPGLALFYGGLVRARNVLSVLMHCFAVACVASIAWLVVVYSLAFDDGGAHQEWIGGLGKVFLDGVGTESLSGTIPETVFFMFQMTFAIITPALIVGAYPERIRFGAVVAFSLVWLVLVYAPACHWVWGGGWLADMGVLDFAGGIVVHVTAGVSALVLAIVLGPRRGFPHEIRPPHSPGMTVTGAAMLWVGWFGFNAGSALAADGNAGMAMTVTHISAAVASLVWAVTEYFRFGKPSVIGIVTGMVAGLAAITPAAGFVGPMGAVVIGIISGFVCQWFTTWIKFKIKIDDSLDVFAVHGVGGILGTLLVAVFAVPDFGGLGLAEGVTITDQLQVQVIGILSVAVWSGVITWVIAQIISRTIGLRVSEESEIEGLDIIAHGERGYDLT